MPRLKSRSGPLPSVVGGRLRAERIRLGLSMAEVARRLGLPRQNVAALEAVANPQLSRLIELAEIGYDVRAIAPELFPGG